MTKPDFEKIFASGGTTLPLTDSQFLQGFAYLGENPPTKEEFNWLFQQLCLKMQWLNQNAGFGRWQADHTYAAGEICFSSVIGDYRFAECTIGGQSGTAEPTWGAVGNTVTDGGVTWIVKDLRQGTSIGKIPALIDVGGGKAGLPAVSGKLLTDISGMPIGSVVPFLANKAQPGWLACDTGALVSRATYPELWTWVQANAPLISETDWQTQAAAQSSVGAYSTGDGSTTFRLPRILDHVRGGLTSEVGGWLPAGLPNIDGTIYSGNSGFKAGGFTGAFSQGAAIGLCYDTYGQTGYAANFDASKSNSIYGGSSTVQPKSIKMIYCVKAFDATTNQGLIDITALANEMAAKTNLTDFAKSHASSGYQKLPNGLIIQWGISGLIASGTNATIALPIAFPNGFLRGYATVAASANLTNAYSCGVSGTTSNISLYAYNPAGSAGYNWLAIGN